MRTHADRRGVPAPAHDASHVAILYRDPAFLASKVAAWCADALRRDGAAILLGTIAHMEMIRAELARMEIDVAKHERAGSYLEIDADWLMGRFIVDGSADPQRFDALVSEMLDRAQKAARGGPTHAWGEMVALLRARNDPRAAHRLEEMWNEALRKREFRLLCSYPTEEEEHGADDALFRSVLSTHGTVVPEPDAIRARLETRARGPGS